MSIHVPIFSHPIVRDDKTRWQGCQVEPEIVEGRSALEDLFFFGRGDLIDLLGIIVDDFLEIGQASLPWQRDDHEKYFPELLLNNPERESLKACLLDLPPMDIGIQPILC